MKNCKSKKNKKKDKEAGEETILNKQKKCDSFKQSNRLSRKQTNNLQKNETKSSVFQKK